MIGNPIAGLENVLITLAVRDGEKEIKKVFTYEQIQFVKYDVLNLGLVYMLKTLGEAKREPYYEPKEAK